MFPLCHHEKKKSQKEVWQKKSLGLEPMHSHLQKSTHYLNTKPTYVCVWLCPWWFLCHSNYTYCACTIEPVHARLNLYTVTDQSNYKILTKFIRISLVEYKTELGI